MTLGRQRSDNFLQKYLVVRQNLAFHATLCGTGERIEACTAQALQSPQQAKDHEYPRTERPLARLHGRRPGSKERRGREPYFEPSFALKGLLQGIEEGRTYVQTRDFIFVLVRQHSCVAPSDRTREVISPRRLHSFGVPYRLY